MTRDDWLGFVKLIKTVDELTVGKERTDSSIAMMFKLLQDYPFEKIQEALMFHVKRCKFMVQVADIVRAIDGDEDDKSLVAWRIFRRAMDRHGFWRSVRFPEPAYHYATELMGGWMRVCEEWRDLSEKDVEFRGRDWRRLYLAGLAKSAWHSGNGRMKVQPHLQGFHEWNNRGGGYLDFIPPVWEISPGTEPDRLAIQSHSTKEIGDGKSKGNHGVSAVSEDMLPHASGGRVRVQVSPDEDVEV